jgi:hypothetical protein
MTMVTAIDPGYLISDRSVYLQADTVVFGSQVEIFTGVSQGTARLFSPRPVVTFPEMPDTPSAIPPAFFDPASVKVNVLEQALINDATGTLTFDIGTTGERGLIVDIDWGDTSTRRFQEIAGLSADIGYLVNVTALGDPLQPIVDPNTGTLAVEHFYTQQDILDSTVNGRTAATEPLNVYFSVRHHDSIFVTGNTIIQNAGPEKVAGGVISSTDNPLTARDDFVRGGLESGRTAFIIPSLSIPIAFIPVRNVIPEIETPVFVVRQETFVQLTQTNITISESSVTTTVGRDEYFQLRVLSANPQGNDLAPPQRLPQDILDGDKIEVLFNALPDGSYEIEYVVGDGNERSILRFDIRGGKAIVQASELNEDLLELKRFDDES